MNVTWLMNTLRYLFPPVSPAKVRGWKGFDQSCWLKKLIPLVRLL